MPLLELTEIDTLLNNCQLKQFAIDLLHPKYGAKIGRYPQTTVTIADPGRGCSRAVAAAAVGPLPQTSPPRCGAQSPILAQKAAARPLQLQLVDLGPPLEAQVGIVSGWGGDGSSPLLKEIEWILNSFSLAY